MPDGVSRTVSFIHHFDGHLAFIYLGTQQIGLWGRECGLKQMGSCRQCSKPLPHRQPACYVVDFQQHVLVFRQQQRKLGGAVKRVRHILHQLDVRFLFGVANANCAQHQDGVGIVEHLFPHLVEVEHSDMIQRDMVLIRTVSASKGDSNLGKCTYAECHAKNGGQYFVYVSHNLNNTFCYWG